MNVLSERYNHPVIITVPQEMESRMTGRQGNKYRKFWCQSENYGLAPLNATCHLSCICRIVCLFHVFLSQLCPSHSICIRKDVTGNAWMEPVTSPPPDSDQKVVILMFRWKHWSSSALFTLLSLLSAWHYLLENCSVEGRVWSFLHRNKVKPVNMFTKTFHTSFLGHIFVFVSMGSDFWFVTYAFFHSLVSKGFKQ